MDLLGDDRSGNSAQHDPSASQVFSPEKCDTKAVESAEAQVQRPLAMLEAVLADSVYLLASRCTVADINVACVLSPSRISAIDMSAFPKVADWARRCHDRPASLATQAMRQAEN